MMARVWHRHRVWPRSVCPSYNKTCVRDTDEQIQQVNTVASSSYMTHNHQRAFARAESTTSILAKTFAAQVEVRFSLSSLFTPT